MNKAVEIAVLKEQYEMCISEIASFRSLYPYYNDIPMQKARHDALWDDAVRFLRAIDLVEKAEVTA